MFNNKLDKAKDLADKYSKSEYEKIKTNSTGELSTGAVPIVALKEYKAKMAKDTKQFIETELSADVQLIKELIKNDAWRVFIDFAKTVEFAQSEDGSLIENLAIQKAKEQAIEAILQLPELIIEKYERLNNG